MDKGKITDFLSYNQTLAKRCHKFDELANYLESGLIHGKIDFDIKKLQDMIIDVSETVMNILLTVIYCIPFFFSLSSLINRR